MFSKISFLIAVLCKVFVIFVLITSVYLLIDIETFKGLIRSATQLPIEWSTVSNLQWYAVWFLAIFNQLIGATGLLFLALAFQNFSKGELFNIVNSRYLRLFAIFIFIQALFSPIHFGLNSLVLSLNHPEGEQILSITFGLSELKLIFLASVLWILSELLLRAHEVESENRQFV